jgi:hypothetical protein
MPADIKSHYATDLRLSRQFSGYIVSVLDSNKNGGGETR